MHRKIYFIGDLGIWKANFVWKWWNEQDQFAFVLDLGVEGLKSRAVELWENIVRLETEKYDLEERQKRQGYDVSSSLKIRRVKQ